MRAAPVVLRLPARVSSPPSHNQRRCVHAPHPWALGKASSTTRPQRAEVSDVQRYGRDGLWRCRVRISRVAHGCAKDHLKRRGLLSSGQSLFDLPRVLA